MFLCSKINRKKLLFISGWNMLQFCRQLWTKSDTSTLRNGKRNANVANVPCCSHCFASQKHPERTNRTNGRGLLPSFCQERTKWLCWLPEMRLNTSLFSEDGGRLFGLQIPKHQPRTKILHYNCVMLIELRSNIFGINLLLIYKASCQEQGIKHGAIL